MSPSMPLPAFDSGTRLLVLAPHPDDETLATGMLIQAAREGGAAVRVVFATDGDNNPWPQRWIEKRWRIDSTARAAWGRRRREEALAALRVFGLDAADARFLGWPDQGLTDCLMRDDEAERKLAAAIADFAPNHVALPSLADRHPDHGALGILGELAIARAGVCCVRLDYLVHGEFEQETPDAGLARSVDAAHQQCKQEALFRHASQLRLSGTRLARIALRPERYAIRTGNGARPLEVAGGDLHLRLPIGAVQRARGHDLLVVLLDETGPRRSRIPLPRLDGSAVAAMRGPATATVTAQVEWRTGHAHVILRGGFAGASHGYVKLERRWPRFVVFDAAGWRDLAEVSAGAADLRPAVLASRKPDPVGIDA